MADEHSLDLFEDADDLVEGGGTTPAGAGGRETARSDAGAGDQPPPPGKVTEEAPEPARGEAAPRPAAAEPRVWSVSQVNRAVRALLEESVEALWVGGEVTGWTRARSGHCYFTLKDDRAQLRCVMWDREARLLPTDPDEGMQVRVFGSLTLYEARGAYQLSVRKLEGEGSEGLWRLAFEKLRQKLDAEGLLDAARKRALPRYPACVGVVTSPTGAAFHDIVTVLRRRAPWVRVVLSGAKVQGEGAALEVARALDALVGSGLPDVVIVGRGGGSVEDLWAFNEEPVARAIARSPVPVVSAVGHEVDVTISDLVADLRAPTPSAAAEAVVPDGSDLVRQLKGVPERLSRGLRGTVEARRNHTRERLGALARAMAGRLAPARQSLDLSAGRLERSVGTLVLRHGQRLAALAGKLEALSPLATLERGYAVARSPDGAVLKSVGSLPPGRPFVLRLHDGSVACEAREQLSEEET